MSTPQTQDDADPPQVGTPLTDEPPQSTAEPLEPREFMEAYGNPRLVARVFNGPIDPYILHRLNGDLFVRDQQSDDNTEPQPVSSEPPAQADDSFMDTYGNPRLGVEEQRADPRFGYEDKTRRHETEEGDSNI